ncbi:hypothetical protein BKA67DRAFT_10402 [Truncatella angustata]|uniref:Uncharacterized protein n=1 Tax=Truncatella angustata TaxID=152316 RepID=A0A9P9A3W9_9PEZI|nr:uncharacterized protein BKA67DRAFT_10402 [Truncatella angustata]KAH6659314.1 hypothetical protein BKA67DRAFT_10402 [Truncatella angustata]
MRSRRFMPQQFGLLSVLLISAPKRNSSWSIAAAAFGRVTFDHYIQQFHYRQPYLTLSVLYSASRLQTIKFQ